MIHQTLNFADTSLPSREGYVVPTSPTGEPQAVEGIIRVGRHHDNEIPLADPHVSLFHCQIEKRPHGFFIRDLKSRNGVTVNGLKVSEAQLLDGTSIQIGTSEFIFRTRNPKRLLDSSLKSQNLDWHLKLQSISPLAQTDLPVLLQGESGTGKEVLARQIHEKSTRREGPFVSVNCSALTENLAESELFGHVKGSFTGATGDRRGAFESARGGTLFLDEIGDLPLLLQPKLLRALENGEIRPVGADRCISTDVRIITATHKNLDAMVREQKFRADLYFRIHVIKISIPPLRERMEDFNDIFYQICKQWHVRFSVAAIEMLKQHQWPGNIRELKNAVARAYALFPNTYIQPEHLQQLLDQNLPQPGPGFISMSIPAPVRSSNLPFLKDIEKELIRTRLIANRGNQRKTAAELGIPKSTLHDRIKIYNIEVKSLVNLERFKENSLGTPAVEDPVET